MSTRYIAFEIADNYSDTLLYAQQVYISHTTTTTKAKKDKPENDFHMQTLKSNNLKM